MPSVDLLGYAHRREEKSQEAKQLAQVKSEVSETVKAVRSRVVTLPDQQLRQQLKGLEDLSAVGKPRELRREAIRKLGELGRTYRKLQGRRRLRSAGLAKQKMKQLKSTPAPLSSELNLALMRGDFARAGELLRDLQEQLERGELSAEQKRALEEQLKQLGEQLEKLIEKNTELARELERLGLDPKLASLDEEALRRALQKLDLDPEKIEHLMAEARACAACNGRLGRLAEVMGSAGAGGALTGDLAELGEQLSALEAMQQEVLLAQAAIDDIDRAIAYLGGQCEGLGAVPWSAGLAQRAGPGTGGPGRGYGPRGEGADADTALTKTRAKNKPGAGPIISSWSFKGPQVRGEARRRFAEAVQAGKDRAAEAISDRRIPRKYEEAVKNYFGRLEELPEE